MGQWQGATASARGTAEARTIYNPFLDPDQEWDVWAGESGDRPEARGDRPDAMGEELGAADWELDTDPGPDLSLRREDSEAWRRDTAEGGAWPLHEIAHRIVQKIRFEADGEGPGQGSVALEALGLTDLEMRHVQKLVEEQGPRWVTLGWQGDSGTVP